MAVKYGPRLKFYNFNYGTNCLVIKRLVIV